MHRASVRGECSTSVERLPMSHFDFGIDKRKLLCSNVVNMKNNNEQQWNFESINRREKKCECRKTLHELVVKAFEVEYEVKKPHAVFLLKHSGTLLVLT